jgi:hypothetical protein
MFASQKSNQLADVGLFFAKTVEEDTIYLMESIALLPGLENIRIVSQPIRYSLAQKFANFMLERTHSISKLYFSGNSLDDFSGCLLMSNFETYQNITSLTIRDNAIGNSTCNAIGDLLLGKV